MNTPTSFLQSVKDFVSSIAPGLFIIGYVIGTGSVTTMVSAGAAYGMSLGWALLLSCFFTGVLLAAISRITIATGHTLMYNLKAHASGWLTFLLIIMLIISAVTSIIGIMGIVSSIVNEWFASVWAENNFPPYLFALLFTALLYLLFLFGKHKIFLKILAVVVAFMGICFLVSMILVVPEPLEVAKGLVPAIPKTGEPQLIIAGMVGTTMAAVVLVSRSVLVQEKGWKSSEMKMVNRDIFVSMLVTFLLSLAIMAAAAGTLYVKGITIDNPVDMVNTLEPLAGRFAISIFVIGIICAGLSSIFPNLVLIPWLICDFFHMPRNMARKEFRILVLLVALSGLFVPVFGGKPVGLMIASQAVSPLIMPLLLILIIWIINNKGLMKNGRAGLFMNVTLVLTLVFSLYMSFIAFTGFLDFLK